MSLDVSLIVEMPVEFSGTGIYVRDGGKTRELSVKEAKERYPDAKDIQERTGYSHEAFKYNVTHNLGDMAEAAGLYDAMWRPYRLHENYDSKLDYDSEMEFEDRVKVKAIDILPHLALGYSNLISDPAYYKSFNPENGWGSYDGLLEFAKKYISACTMYPDALVEVDR